MALICEQSPFILSADDIVSSSSHLQLSLSPEPFDPSVFALLMAWPSAGQQHQSSNAGSSTGSSRGGNAGTPLSPLSSYTGTGGSSGGTPPSRLTPGSSNDSSSLSYASSAPQAGLDNASRPSAVAEFQLLHPSGRADDASPYPGAYGYRTHENIEEGANAGLYHSSNTAAAPSHHQHHYNTPSTQSSPQAPYFSSPDTLYPQSFESGPAGSYDAAAYGSLGGGSGPSAYPTPSGQMTPALQFTFPHGGSTPSGDSVDDPSPSPQSSGSDSPSLTAHSGSSSGLSRRRSSSRAGYDPNVAFMPPMAQIRKRPRRKAEEIDRIYTCGFEGCPKSYGTLNHLNAHVRNASHGEKRRPEEFRDIRNAWKRKKAQEAQETQAAQAAHAAEEQRQRLSGSGPRPTLPLRRPSADEYHQPPASLAHRQQHTPGLGLPSMPQALGLSRMTGHGMAPQGYGFPPSMPSTGLSPYTTRGPPTPWTPTDRGMVSPNHHYMDSSAQEPNQFFSQPIRLPQPPTGFNPAAGPRGVLEYPSRQGSNGVYPPPRDPARQ